MRIDAHTHVFTLHTILSREAIRVITQRLEDTGFVPEPLAEAIGDLLMEQLNKPEYLDERRLLRKLVEKLTGIGSFNDIVKNRFGSDNISIQLEGDLDDLAAEALSDIITRVLDGYEGTGKVDKILDIIQTLRQSMQPTITDVADDLLQHMDDDGVIVALMMDIFKGPETEVDRRRYIAQIDGHAEAALQRPGRVLPFFGVHPDRPGHLDQLKQAVERKGFVGVKLYPSLGYAVDSEEMRKVYRYCIEKDLPVLLHCGHGGFYRDQEKKQLCDPEQWKDVLAHPDFKDLRVCFAHFGGWEALGKQEYKGPPAKENWGQKIYDYMKQYPNVYTDLAKHVNMFEEEEGKYRDTYFDTMRQLIGELGPRILFGTDAWLLRLDMPFDRYWELWRTNAGPAWDAITIEGPRAFLGLDPDPTKWRKNIERYVDHMTANRTNVGREPPPWLKGAVAEPFNVDRDPPDWDRTKLAVRDTYQFLGPYLRRSQKDDGFAANREVKLEELTYFDRGDPNFAGKCRDMARRFVDFADQDFGYREGHDFGSSVDLFIGIFRKGDLRLCDVAMTLNTLIAYPEVIA